ncbi:helix-turn-helix domain-containing protein [Salinirubellus sp. GCM10025818]|uniref:helix-turn-helix domain-containing protein n=1 Tax=Salinirubellus TaxID=2162630 RepID=UPI0030CA5C30
MRYLELSVRRSAEERHSMHGFVVEHDDYEVTRQLSRHQHAEDEHAVLFHVEGPVEPYRSEIAAVPSVVEFEIAPCPDGSFYLYVRDRITEGDRRLLDAFSQSGLVLTGPVEYRSDGTVRLVVVGPTDAVGAAVEEVPETEEVEVLAVGERLSSRVDSRLDLTGRQFEAVTAAVESGYFEVPREATLDDVAARLGCSTGAAGELLRRAERTVMADLVEGGPF